MAALQMLNQYRIDYADHTSVMIVAPDEVAALLSDDMPKGQVAQLTCVKRNVRVRTFWDCSHITTDPLAAAVGEDTDIPLEHFYPRNLPVRVGSRVSDSDGKTIGRVISIDDEEETVTVRTIHIHREPLLKVFHDGTLDGEGTVNSPLSAAAGGILMTLPGYDETAAQHIEHGASGAVQWVNN
jgi:hypothetical protein